MNWMNHLSPARPAEPPGRVQQSPEYLNKHRLSERIVASQIINYEIQRVGADGIVIYRGDITQGHPTMLAGLKMYEIGSLSDLMIDMWKFIEVRSFQGKN